jgi:hypothetical protein
MCWNYFAPAIEAGWLRRGTWLGAEREGAATPEAVGTAKNIANLLQST